MTHNSSNTVALVVASPYIEDLKHLSRKLFPLSNDADDGDAHWIHYGFGTSLYLSRNAVSYVVEAVLTYMGDNGFGPTISGGERSLPNVYADQTTPGESTHLDKPQSPLTDACRERISVLQTFVSDAVPERPERDRGSHRVSAWIFDDTVAAVSLTDGCWIVGGRIAWWQEFTDVPDETFTAAIEQLRASREGLSLVRPLQDSEQYFEILPGQLEHFWTAMELAPRTAAVMKTRDLIRQSAIASGHVFVVDYTPTVEAALWFSALDAMVTVDCPTLHGGWLQLGRLVTLAQLHAWTAPLTGSTLGPALSLEHDGRLGGHVFSAQHGTYVDASNYPPTTTALYVKYRNPGELRLLERTLTAAWSPDL